MSFYRPAIKYIFYTIDFYRNLTLIKWCRYFTLTDGSVQYPHTHLQDMLYCRHLHFVSYVDNKHNPVLHMQNSCIMNYKEKRQAKAHICSIETQSALDRSDMWRYGRRVKASEASVS